MSGHFKFGNNVDEALLGIFHQVLQFFLSIVTAVTSVLGISPSTDFGELRILLNFDTPSLVLSEVKVNVVDLVHGKNVDVLLQLFDAEEVAANVDQRTAIFKARSVFNGAGCSLPAVGSLCGNAAFNSGWQQLQEALHGIEQTLLGRSLCCYSVGCNGQGVGFFSLNALVEEEGDATGLLFLGKFDVVAGSFVDFVNKELSHVFCFLGIHRGLA